MHRKAFFSLLMLLFLGHPLFGQSGNKNSADILHSLKKLNKVGSVLYFAAHPDDENTSVIGYMENEEHLRAGYLSLTRGDGGQNLIGPEKGPLLGVLRTQELLEARNVDGGEQFFSRAIDFGYSKTAEETFNIWKKERILEDAVRVIRKFRPDVIITRFPGGGYSGGHGHHTGSAILAAEAYEKAADPEAYPQQLEHLETWQPKRLLFNTSTWWDKKLPKKAPKDPDLIEFNLGGYNPLLGKSYTQIAAQSRSMHKCQGFGVSLRRGKDMEYFKYLKGEKVEKENVLDGLNLSWNRLEKESKIGKKIDRIIQEFNPNAPHESVPELIEVHRLLDELADPYWQEQKQEKVEKLILACTGTQLEATADRESVSPGDEMKITATAINGSSYPLQLEKVQLIDQDTTFSTSLPYEEYRSFTSQVTIPDTLEYTAPYWLEQKPRTGTYRIPENKHHLIGNPVEEPQVKANYTFSAEGRKFEMDIPVEYEWTSKVEGEVREPFILVPEVTVKAENKVNVFPDSESKELMIKVSAWQDEVGGQLILKTPEGWAVKPSSHTFSMSNSGEEQTFKFKVTPPQDDHSGELRPTVKIGDKELSKTLDQVNYDHITKQTVVRDASSHLVRENIQTKGKRIGYLMGSGDEIPEALRQLGYKITRLKPDDLSSEDLSRFDAIVTGVRAFNVHESLKHQNKALFDYVKKGGHLVVQYNKDEEALVTKDVGPYPFRISYDRVTVETAPAEFLQEDHPLLNQPNKITQEDMQGWVQERGLYFADEWDDQYTPLISWNDPDEDPKKGGLLVADHGKGTFIYTGISFFRQLPAGVPGAYKLFGNLISYGAGE